LNFDLSQYILTNYVPPNCTHQKAKYKLHTNLQGPSCPTGLEISENNCLTAAQRVGVEYKPDGWFNVGDWDHTPCGCFLWTRGNGTVQISYDRGQAGACNSMSSAKMICQKVSQQSSWMATFWQS